ncbi:uncharacterized protein ACHE_70158A [Aspergillus chevalieri]|uniref:Acyltransferase n=1 Tax=Aspergillus chevalieri TaxID=182096 RepID=A0A7R7VVC4_ASPCH|nr:uncharacterized protein ACHE_70158A [Aspergillus chevalieri]BCR91315.1 hypothetical protein ACHE_70158A [Aspergillus chevalieri]
MLGWTETSPGVFKKDFDGAEKIYRKILQSFAHYGKEHWCLHCICSLRFDPSVHSPESTAGELRNAWKLVRFEFPGLSIIPDDLTKVYTIPTAAAVEQWADETFFVETEKQPDQVLSTIQLPRELPSLYYFPSSSEILFVSSHWRIDAIGTCMLLDRFFTIFVEQPGKTKYEIQWEKEIDNMSPSMEDAAGSATVYTPEIEDLAQKAIAKHQEALKTAGLPYHGDKTTIPGDSSRQAFAFTKESTRNLVSACRAKGITVTAAIHSALAETIFLLGPSEHQDLDHTAVMSVNIRKYLPSPYNSPSHACQTYVTGITPRARRHSSFLDRAAALKEEYKSWYSDLYLHSLRLIYKYHGDALFAPPKPDAAPPSGVFMSSLGVIEPYLRGDYGSLQVEEFRFGVSMITRQMIVYAWTFHNQLVLSVNYNEAYYNKDLVQDVLEKTRSCLETELGVKCETVCI